MATCVAAALSAGVPAYPEPAYAEPAYPAKPAYSEPAYKPAYPAEYSAPAYEKAAYSAPAYSKPSYDYVGYIQFLILISFFKESSQFNWLILGVGADALQLRVGRQR